MFIGLHMWIPWSDLFLINPTLSLTEEDQNNKKSRGSTTFVWMLLVACYCLVMVAPMTVLMLQMPTHICEHERRTISRKRMLNWRSKLVLHLLYDRSKKGKQG
jgi:hypothetical protein